jgi:hypothetical protein
MIKELNAKEKGQTQLQSVIDFFNMGAVQKSEIIGMGIANHHPSFSE